jgi:hypothetical protein
MVERRQAELAAVPLFGGSSDMRKPLAEPGLRRCMHREQFREARNACNRFST